MRPVFLAMMVIVVGAAVRAGGGAVTSKGNAKLVGYGLMLAGFIAVGMNAVVVIGVGEVGVKHFWGTVDPISLPQGIHFINPLASVEKMSVREQAYPPDGSVERIDAQTSEQMNVALEISLLFRIDPALAPELYQTIGTEEDIKRRIILNAVRNGVRDAIATKSINEIFSPNRREVSAAMVEAVQAKAGARIEVLDVFVRDIQTPPRVREAIEEKLQREQQVAAERFQTEIIQERARQEVEAAKGLAEAQRIITAGLTPAYLPFHYIETLGELPGGSVVYVPTEGGVPLMRNIGGGR
ncbi:MAG: prohibitin family protein [Gemmatimonadetes bacterium]|nr:prohibitin family protein [Gemmatimonadota bacterium]